MEIETLKLDVPLGNPEFVYVYLVDSEVLIDGGFCSEESAERISEVEPKHALITHHHVDHIGYIFFSEISAFLHPFERSLIYIYETPWIFVERQQRICERYGIPKDYVKPLEVLSFMKLRLRAKIEDLGNKSVFGFTPIHVPGHSPGHMCFLRDNALFSGDAILSDTTPNLSFYPEFPYGLREYLSALEKLKKLDVEVVYPAHERRILDLRDRIECLIQHYTQRTAEVLELIKKNPMTVEEIAKNIKWSPGDYEKLDLFDKYLALLETLSYLRYLKEEGKAIETETRPARFYGK
ncbi:MAG: MBL fold metallo-hydrolase [Candidatus Methanoglobus sp.]